MPAGTRYKHLRKAGAFTTGQLLAGEVGVNTAAGQLEFSPDGSTLKVIQVQEIPFSFLSDSPGYYTATVACTVGSPSTLRGSGSIAWAYSTDGVTFSAATFPLSMAANSVLRGTASGITSYQSITLQRS